MDINEIIAYANRYLNEADIPACNVVEILQRTNHDGSVGYQVTFNERQDIDVGYIMKINIEGFQDGYFEIPEWDYSVDSYLFDDLENGYEIVYMPLDYHYGVWCCIDEQRHEVDHHEGLQKYLKYCKDHDITQKVLLKLGSYANDIPDVMNLYQETNSGCLIIDEFSVGERSIVLAYKSATNEYVTWRTTPTRKRGFDCGHYLKNFHQAYDDFKERSHGILNDYFIEHKYHVRLEKEKNSYER